MSNISSLTMDPSKPMLDDMLRKEAARVVENMDSFNASRHNERTEVAARYVHDFLRKGGSPTEPIGLSEVLQLDPSAVADFVAGDLGPAGKARIKDMLRDLIDHAHQYLAETEQSTAEEIPSSLLKGLAEFIECNLARHVSYPIRRRITLDLAVHPSSANFSR